MEDKLISKVPEGPLAEKWTKHKAAIRVVSPANKRKLDIIVIGTGLGGASAAATLGELGYNVKIFCISDSPRRAHSIAAQGGIKCTVSSTTPSREATTAAVRPMSTGLQRSAI